MSFILTRATSAVPQASLLWGTFYLTLNGPIKINNTATLETMPLDEGPQLFVTPRNEGTDCANTFGLAMFQKRLN